MARTTQAETKRLLVILAALNLKNSEIAELSHLVKAGSTEALTLQIRAVEREVFGPVSSKAPADDSDNVASATYDAVITQVLHLLKDEARLKNAEISAALLSEGLLSGATPVAGWDNHRSIGDWLRRVTREWGASRLLSVATSVRNKVVHQERSPWSIRSRDE